VSVLMELNREMAVLVDRVKRSLVEVRDGRGGGAAGTVWHARGLIVTNAHIIGRGRANVTFPDGTTSGTTVLAIDRERDLAALSVDAEGLIPITLGDSKALQPGQFVLAMGHPWGVKGVATAGVVMAAAPEYLRISYAQDLVAVNVPLRPGNSGGPLVDVEGRLVGINTMMTGEDTGLAIPVHVAKAFLREALGSNTRRRA
jgi:serine protease Do